jgi:hypothetical protein
MDGAAEQPAGEADDSVVDAELPVISAGKSRRGNKAIYLIQQRPTTVYRCGEAFSINKMECYDLFFLVVFYFFKFRINNTIISLASRLQPRVVYQTKKLNVW